MPGRGGGAPRRSSASPRRRAASAEWEMGPAGDGAGTPGRMAGPAGAPGRGASSRPGSPRKKGGRGERSGEREKVLAVLRRTGRQTPDQPDFVHGRLKHYGPNKVGSSPSQPPVPGGDLGEQPAAPRLRRRARLAHRHRAPGQGRRAAGQGRGSGATPRSATWPSCSSARGAPCSTRVQASPPAPASGRLPAAAAAKWRGAPMRARGWCIGRSSSSPGASPPPQHRLRAGLVQDWVQLNYDGLAQKAGCPQEAVLEVGPALLPQVHGSWYDPSNPVVKPKGKMRDDMFQVPSQGLVPSTCCSILHLIPGPDGGRGARGHVPGPGHLPPRHPGRHRGAAPCREVGAGGEVPSR